MTATKLYRTPFSYLTATSSTLEFYMPYVRIARVFSSSAFNIIVQNDHRKSSALTNLLFSCNLVGLSVFGPVFYQNIKLVAIPMLTIMVLYEYTFKWMCSYANNGLTRVVLVHQFTDNCYKIKHADLSFANSFKYRSKFTVIWEANIPEDSFVCIYRPKCCLLYTSRCV